MIDDIIEFIGSMTLIEYLIVTAIVGIIIAMIGPIACGVKHPTEEKWLKLCTKEVRRAKPYLSQREIEEYCEVMWDLGDTNLLEVK